MPASNTITSTDLVDFVAGTTIKSAEVDGNFSIWRGNLLPVDVATSSAVNLSYNVGAPDYRYLNGYISKINFGETTTSWSLEDESTSGGDLIVNKNSSEVTRVSSDYGFTRVAIIEDVKGVGVNGGDFNSGNWRQRDLTTITGDTSFATISSNQFSLFSGRYLLDSEAPAYAVNSHISRIRNITAGTNQLLGTPEFAPTAQTRSRVVGVINISTATVFQLQHLCALTHLSNGFGVASNQAPETYSQIKIIKIK